MGVLVGVATSCRMGRHPANRPVIAASLINRRLDTPPGQALSPRSCSLIIGLPCCTQAISKDAPLLVPRHTLYDEALPLSTNLDGNRPLVNPWVTVHGQCPVFANPRLTETARDPFDEGRTDQATLSERVVGPVANPGALWYHTSRRGSLVFTVFEE